MPKRKIRRVRVPMRRQPIVTRSGDVRVPVPQDKPKPKEPKPKEPMSKQSKLKVAGAVLGTAAIAAAGIGIGVALHKQKQRKQNSPRVGFDMSTTITPRDQINHAAIYDTPQQWAQDPSWDDWDGGDISMNGGSNHFPEINIGPGSIYLDPNNLYA